MSQAVRALEQQSSTTIQEFRDLIPHLPDLSLDYKTQALAWAQGKLSDRALDMAAQIAFAQSRFPIKTDHPRLAIFTGNQTTGLAQNLTDGKSLLPFLCQQCDADLRLYEMATPDAGMDENQFAHAIAYGMMSVEVGIDVMVLWGEDFDAPRVQAGEDPLNYIWQHGTRPVAAMFGAILAARMAKVPVILLGDSAQKMPAILNSMWPILSQHLIAGNADLDGFAALLQQIQAVGFWQKA